MTQQEYMRSLLNLLNENLQAQSAEKPADEADKPEQIAPNTVSELGKLVSDANKAAGVFAQVAKQQTDQAQTDQAQTNATTEISEEGLLSKAKNFVKDKLGMNSQVRAPWVEGADIPYFFAELFEGLIVLACILDESQKKGGSVFLTAEQSSSLSQLFSLIQDTVEAMRNNGLEMYEQDVIENPSAYFNSQNKSLITRFDIQHEAANFARKAKNKRWLQDYLVRAQELFARVQKTAAEINAYFKANAAKF